MNEQDPNNCIVLWSNVLFGAYDGIQDVRGENIGGYE